MKILVTGTAGFIGFHLTNRLLEAGHEVVGLDVINDYYDINLKYDRLREAGIDPDTIQRGQLVSSSNRPGYRFIQEQLEDDQAIDKLFREEQFDMVVNLAAQAGVRYSLENPRAYTRSNVDGFLNILEGCRHHGVKHLVFASSSSVYGLNTAMPFSVHQNVDHPISLYAATKKANELMAHTYSHLYGIRATGLRFFTVYGTWGRPDMALFIFTRKILNGDPIQVFNEGNMLRDFTYIDDIVSGIEKVMIQVPEGNPEWNSDQPDPGTSVAPYRLYNIGNNSPVKLMDFVSAIEEELRIEADKEFMPLQPGDVPRTYANVDDLVRNTGFQPNTAIRTGVKAFIEWYRSYYHV